MGVRNEAVRLSLEDDFTSGMAKAAAMTALLNRELKSLSGQSVQTSRATKAISRETDAVGVSAGNADRSINQLTGRLRLFADVAAILGPSLVPIGAVAVPAIVGLANEMGAAALAGGVLVTAFQGVGDALKKVELARIEPTTKHLADAQRAMAQLGPEAQDAVKRLQALRPALRELRDTAAAGLFPGFFEGLDALESRADDVERILESVSTTLGDLFAETGESFASARWDDFFDFLATDVPDTIESLWRTVGDLTHGMAELWMAFDPLNDDFSGWLEEIADGFDRWAQGLSETEGFTEFIDYIRTNGPQVAETFGALADAVLEIAEAAAPLGGPVLAGVEALAKTIAAIADSDLGTPIMTAVGALALFNRTAALTEGALARVGARGTTFGRISSGADRARGSLKSLGRDVAIIGTTYATAGARSERATKRLEASTGRVKTAGAGLGKTAAGIGALTLATTDLGDSLHVTNTASLGFVGAMSGFKRGGFIGAAIGGIMDLSEALSVTADDMQHFFDMTAAQAGGDPAAEIAALTDELERQQKIMDKGHGLDLGITKVWSSDAAAKAAEKAELLKDRIAQLNDEQEVSEAAADAAGGSLGREGDAAARAARDLQQFTDSLTAQRQERIINQSAILGYEQALIDAKKAAKENNDVLGKNGRLLKGQEQAGVTAKKTLLDLAGAWNNQSEKVRRNTGNQREAIDAFVRTARQMGYSKKAAEEYAESLFNIPPKRKTTVTVTASGMEIIESQLNSLTRPRHVAVIVNGHVSGGKFADGGIVEDGVRKFADGGWGANGRYYDRTPQVVKGGANILWGEQETGREAYISDKPGMRDRNVAVLNQAASWFGMGLAQKFADGGLSGRWWGAGAQMERPMASSSGYGGPGAAGPIEAHLSDAGAARIADRLGQLRPLYGGVTVIGDNAFERDQRLRAAAGIGR